ncbi:hypothetical protein TSOC_006368 [Tetrabaena socialis]|uniref:Uncharacterized protein n=1 Tax=Tetrabaena socialis TaxID=47790 RepID=A0A2J8A3U8_9CHLO|nr:hypothetical protein TSOC_006368 [Tetrabaena socialis]|eukprot:PNH07191.1 hypothetical protein TSOC_006368 [Tetrabaena socialis]
MALLNGMLGFGKKWGTMEDIKKKYSTIFKDRRGSDLTSRFKRLKQGVTDKNWRKDSWERTDKEFHAKIKEVTELVGL